MGIGAVYGSPPPCHSWKNSCLLRLPGQSEAEPLPERTHLTFGSSTKAALPGPSAPLSL